MGWHAWGDGGTEVLWVGGGKRGGRGRQESCREKGCGGRVRFFGGVVALGRRGMETLKKKNCPKTVK